MYRRDVLTIAAGALSRPVLRSGTTSSTQSSAYEPLGRISLTNAKEALVDAAGTTAFVAATNGFATVDISTPAEPTIMAEQRQLLADRENGPLREIWDVKVDNDRLIVAGPANPEADVVRGFLLYDVSDPADPKRLAFYETEFPIHNCFIRDGLAYLTGNNSAGNPLVIVDVSGKRPEEVGRWSMLDHNDAWADVNPWLRTLHDIWVQDGHAFLAQWDAGTWVVDVTNPVNPKYVSNFSGRPREQLARVSGNSVNTAVIEPPGNHHYVTLNDDGSILGAGVESWDNTETKGGGPSGIELWNITDPQNPQKLSTIEPPSTPDPTYDRRWMLSYGVGNAHLGCHECSQGGTDGVWTTAHNFDIRGDRLFSSWYQGGVKIYDISDPTDPEQLVWWRKPAETAFWTAKRATDGVFIASSMGRNNDGKGGLYTFPNRRGQQQNPPALTPSNTTRTTER